MPPSQTDDYNLLFKMPELDTALSSCRHSAAPGLDGISYLSLCHLGVDGRTALLSRYNDTWVFGTVPDYRKISRLVALLKAGKPYERTPYRPVALASCVGNVIKRRVLARLQWFLESNALYPYMMTVFRRGRSSTDGVIDLVATVEQEKHRRRLVAAVFVGINGAYDHVLHDVILDALDHLGVGGRLYLWIVSYLNGRSVYISTPDGETACHQVCVEFLRAESSA